MTDEQISYPAGTIVWLKMEVKEERLSSVDGKQKHFLRLCHPGHYSDGWDTLVTHEKIETNVRSDD